MLRIKKLDLYVLSNFVPVFMGSFLICLFVFIMQFTWRYVEELVGKGLSMSVLAEFFWYTAISLVPMALPLSVLLAMLISFGNMGERFELLAMRSAGVSLLRIMRPLFIIACITAGLSFYFQNNISTVAQIKIRQLLISMKQTSPALEIPEGVFYNNIPNINLYVESKQSETGMLYRLIIYKMDGGIDNAQIVLADSGRLEMTEDKMYVKLQLWSGKTYTNQLAGRNVIQNLQEPFYSETFVTKLLYIKFDANFNLMDQAMLNNTPSAKSMKQLEIGTDSINSTLDSIGRGYYYFAMNGQFKMAAVSSADTVHINKVVEAGKVNFDSLAAKLTNEQMLSVVRQAKQTTIAIQNDWDWRKVMTDDNKLLIRKFQIEWHNKIALSLSCVIFFFVGGALGAIIRKGGLGMPTVISVMIFIFYYIFNTSGMKMAKDGSWPIWYGMWVSTALFAPLGLFLTYKANKDSVVFNIDVYRAAVMRFLGIRSSRYLAKKEVIIELPDYRAALGELREVQSRCKAYMQECKLYLFPNYIKTFFRHNEDHEVATIADKLEAVILRLSYTDNQRLISQLNTYPVMYRQAHVSPFHKKWLNVASGMLFPIGIVLCLRMWRFRLRLLADLRQIGATSKDCVMTIETHIINECEGCEEDVATEYKEMTDNDAAIATNKHNK